MPVLALLLLAVWTYLVMRLLSIRATLHNRALLTYLILGALLAITAVSLVEKMVVPYGTFWPFQAELVAIGRLAVIFLPVLLTLLARRTYHMLSVADGFLLGFMTGFGFDLIGTLIAATTATQNIPGMSFFPPWQYTETIFHFVVAGSGYWNGLAALALVASLRFLRRTRWVVLVSALVFLYSASEEATLLPSGPVATDLSTGWFAALIGHGKYTAWITLAALIALQVYEWLWVQRTLQAGSGFKLALPASVTAMLAALRQGHFAELGRLSTLLSLQRQAALVHAELRYSPADTRLQQQADYLEQIIHQYESPRPAAPLRLRSLLIGILPWKNVSNLLTTLAILVFLLLLVPKGLSDFFYGLPLLQSPFLSLHLTVLMAILVAAILWRYVMAAGEPGAGGTVDDLVRFQAEKALLQICLGTIFLVLFALDLKTIYPFTNWIATLSNTDFPQLTEEQIGLLLLALAAAASGLSRQQAEGWQAAPLEERRFTALRNLLLALSAFTILWVTTSLYIPSVETLHAVFGEKLQSSVAFILQNLLRVGDETKAKDMAGPWVANILSFFMVVFMAIISFSLTFVFRYCRDQIERFFTGRTEMRMVRK